MGGYRDRLLMSNAVNNVVEYERFVTREEEIHSNLLSVASFISLLDGDRVTRPLNVDEMGRKREELEEIVVNSTTSCCTKSI